MNDNSVQSVRSVRDIRAQVESLFADWIKIDDNKSQYTIEDFPYKEGVPDKVENHCWKCVTVNQCLFANQVNKKPEEFNYDSYSYKQISNDIRGLYHPHCHCRKVEISVPSLDNIELITLE